MITDETIEPGPRTRSRPPRPDRPRPHVIGELLVVLTLVRVYDQVRALAAPRQAEAIQHGLAILQLERFLRLDIEHRADGWLSHSWLLSEAAASWYQFVHLPVSLGTLAACYWWRPDFYRRARNSLVGINLVGLLVFWLYPAAPPRLLPGHAFIDVGVQAGFAPGPGGPVSADMFAAMPSLHVAWATWSVLVLRQLLREHSRVRALVPCYAVVTALVVVSTANHYVLDVVAGAALALAATWLTGLPSSRLPVKKLLRSRDRPSPRPHPAPGTQPAPASLTATWRLR